MIFQPGQCPFEANKSLPKKKNTQQVVGIRGFWDNFKSTKKYALNQRIKIQQTFPSFPHKLKLFPTAKPNATKIFVRILADDELFEFV